MKSLPPWVICVVGPTGTGKSEVGIEVAKRLGGEVLSADSMQVYRGMDIGTAKVMPSEQQGVPHHLLDLVNPDEPFTVAMWAEAARQKIAELHSEQKVPVVVGGTGLYIRAITDDLSFAGTAGSAVIREKWQTFCEEQGRAALHHELALRDPSSAQRLHPNDVRRVIRALELFELGDVPMSDHYEWAVRGGQYNVVQIGLYVQRDRLYERVERRVDRMCEQGLVHEVAGLLERDFSPELTSMQAIGYKEMARAIQGLCTVDEAIDDIKRATRRFVKRQLSWFMRDPRIHWFSLTQGGGYRKPETDKVLKTIQLASEGIR